MTNPPVYRDANHVPPAGKPGPDSKYEALWAAVIAEGQKTVECETPEKADSRRMYLRKMSPVPPAGESWDIVRRGRFVFVGLVDEGDPS